MSTENALREVEALLDKNRPTDAEERLRALIYTMGAEEVRAWEFDLRSVVEKFRWKRQRGLSALLDNRLGVAEQPPEPAPRRSTSAELGGEFRAQLSILSDRHIYQWGTFYREAFLDWFTRFSHELEIGEPAPSVTVAVRDAVAWHSTEIFQKGSDFVGTATKTKQEQAIAKSLSGLQRFLEIPIEIYAARSSTTLSPSASRASRTIASAMLAGVLSGYSFVRFGDTTGAQVLPRSPRAWAHYLAFLDRDGLLAVTAGLEPGDFSAGISICVQPVIDAIDQLSATATDYVPLPVLSQFVWLNRRLEVSLKPPPNAPLGRALEILAYLDPGFVSANAIREAVARDVCLVVAVVRPDLKGAVQAIAGANDILVSPGDDAVATNRATLDAVRWGIYRRRSLLAGTVPLSYNFAREFPLQNPNLASYYHVFRSSVRELMRTFERRNGVRLWCSVRRSGKTTACFDLGATTGGSAVVSQTCGAAKLPDANVFYQRVVDALKSAADLDRDFFRRLASELAGRDAGSDRIVFVLDEYETLFGRLRTEARREPLVRYAVVQPLLNQMVDFAADNLLVFLGQQPTAHFILMDQNQLSPYVEQDAFPLFHHVPGGPPGEFRELVRRVLTERVEFTAGFVDSLFAETAGHPFLTVKLLVAIVDWLVEQARPVGDLRLAANDYEEFAVSKLTTAEVGRSQEYSFFREAIAEAICLDAATDQPWLYAVYRTLREIGRQFPSALSCSLSDYRSLVESLRLDQVGITPDALLGSAMQANFLYLDQDTVSARIRLLGRIAAISSPKLAG